MDVKPQSQSQPATQRAVRQTTKSKGNKLVTLLVVLLIVAVVAVVGYFAYQAKQPTPPDSSKFQAVFMTNGQVYFGKLTKLGSKYTELSKVYYLQVQQPVQPSSGAKATKDSQVSLTKLGNELHGPTDKMNISSDQVLFWEDLKDDSTVVKAIKDYENR